MPTITDWLMVAITAIYVIATIFICAANIRSAKATKGQIAEMQRQFQEMNRPYVTCEYVLGNRTFRGIRICNHGNMVAKGLIIRINQEFIDCIKGYSDEYGQSFYETESEILNNCDTENNKALAFIDKESFSQKNTKHYVYTTQAYYKIISKEFIKIGVQQTVSIDIIDTNENEVTVYLSNFTGEEPENIQTIKKIKEANKGKGVTVRITKSFFGFGRIECFSGDKS